MSEKVVLITYLTGEECPLDSITVVSDIVVDIVAKVYKKHSEYLPQEIHIIDRATGNDLKAEDPIPEKVVVVFREGDRSLEDWNIALTFFVTTEISTAFSRCAAELVKDADFASSILVNYAEKGIVAVVRALLHEGIDVNHDAWIYSGNATYDAEIGPSPTTALYGGAKNNHMDMVKFLVEAKADVNAWGERGESPLFVCAEFGYIEMAEFLIQSRANVNGNCLGTPLFVAAWEGRVEVVNLLLKSNADINAAYCVDGAPLFAGACKGHHEVVNILLDANADVNANAVPNHNDFMIADWDTRRSALLGSAQGGHHEIVRTLLKHGADINAGSGSCFGTALCASAGRGHLKVVEVLLNEGANVDAVDQLGRTPLIASMGCGYAEVVEVLRRRRTSDRNGKHASKKVRRSRK